MKHCDICLLSAEEDYIDSFYRAVNDKYGSFDNFILNGLKIEENEQNRLKMKYLE